MALSDPSSSEIFYKGLMGMSSWQVTNGDFLMYILGSYFFTFHIDQTQSRCFPLWLIMYSEYK